MYNLHVRGGKKTRSDGVEVGGGRRERTLETCT